MTVSTKEYLKRDLTRIWHWRQIQRNRKMFKKHLRRRFEEGYDLLNAYEAAVACAMLNAKLGNMTLIKIMQKDLIIEAFGEDYRKALLKEYA